jgi:hypothetical protein
VDRRSDQPHENNGDTTCGIIARRETGGARHITASGQMSEAMMALNREGTVGSRMPRWLALFC